MLRFLWETLPLTIPALYIFYSLNIRHPAMRHVHFFAILILSAGRGFIPASFIRRSFSIRWSRCISSVIFVTNLRQVRTENTPGAQALTVRQSHNSHHARRQLITSDKLAAAHFDITAPGISPRISMHISPRKRCPCFVSSTRRYLYKKTLKRMWH